MKRYAHPMDAFAARVRICPRMSRLSLPLAAIVLWLEAKTAG